MATTSFLFSTPDGLDLNSVDERHVRTVFIARLPFRLKTGSLFTLDADDDFAVVFHNRIDIPHGTPTEDIDKLKWVGERPRGWKEFMTEAMVIDSKPKVDAATAQALAACLAAKSDAGRPSYRERYFDALSALNDTIVAYHSATRELFGGSPVERLTSPEWMYSLRYVHTLVCPPEHQLTDDDLRTLLDARDSIELIQGEQWTGSFDDLPPEKLATIPSFLPRQRRFLFYQFALDAKSRMAEQDDITAILFAVVALEAVHAALLQLCLDRILGPSELDATARSKLVEEKAERLLRDVGFSEMVEFTSTMLLKPEERPAHEDVVAGKIGITIRNEIMHALSKKGQYKLRNRTNTQITEAYKSVLRIYDHFVRLVESMT